MPLAMYEEKGAELTQAGTSAHWASRGGIRTGRKAFRNISQDDSFIEYGAGREG